MTRLFHLLALVFLALLPSCSSQKFYDKVTVGQIVGSPYVRWELPNRFELESNDAKPFAFIRANQEIIRPRPIKTDGGSLPRGLWDRKGYSPWTYAPGYLIHDWLYEANRRKVPAGMTPDGKPLYYDKEKSDWILAEVIKTQMESNQKAFKDPNPGRLAAIYWAVKRFGTRAWNGQPTPVAESALTPLLYSAAGNLPLLPTLNALQSELMTLPPEKPLELSGSTTPYWLNEAGKNKREGK